ncbi:phage terminase [Tritonibacter scottomollicae]|uniref:Phage terminase n=1 Tax=Tritonibacter scottomollicae TaxID=483013 RepID=A0A2T1A9M8_TRISK|nr:phage terminase [Tritonibacter scottomollicae]
MTAWAQAVQAGEVVAGPYVRAAADRHLRDLVEGPKRGLKWDLAAALRAIRFFPQVLRLNGGQFEGRPFELHPGQAFRIGSLFGWKQYSAQHGAWLRRFTRFYDEEGKGNGKSPMLGGIGLYMMVADGEPRAEIYAAAAKKDQAGILFQDAVAMVDQSPVLKRKVQQQGGNPVWQMTYRGRGGDKRKFKPLSAEKAQSDPRPHCALTDEVHACRSTQDRTQHGRIKRAVRYCRTLLSTSPTAIHCRENVKMRSAACGGICLQGVFANVP